jgi:TorA maturation chaperone TorD
MSHYADPRVAQARSGTYLLLASLVLGELDAEAAEMLSDMPVFGEAMAASGGPGAVQALRAEYTRTFLMNLHPYESVFVDDSGLLNTPSSGAVLRHYRERAFESRALPQVGAPDHLGLELEFMAYLVEREADARRAGDAGEAGSFRADQLHFLEAHLVKWAPLFGRALTELADTPLYRTLGQAIETFVLGDYQALSESEAASGDGG